MQFTALQVIAMAKGFIEIDAGIAIVILIATLTMMAALFLHSTSELKEKTDMFKHMEQAIGGSEVNCIASIQLKEDKLARDCNDYFS